MAKVTPEAMAAISKAMKNRTVKQYDMGEKETVISRVTYDEKDRQVSRQLIGRIKHGT